MSFTVNMQLEKIDSATRVNKYAVIDSDMDILERGYQVHAIAGESLTQWQAVYISTSDARAYRATAALAGLAVIVGVCNVSAATSADVYVNVGGVITNAAWTWTPGGIVYIDPTTPGTLTQTPSAFAIGVARTATTLALFWMGATSRPETVTILAPSAGVTWTDMPAALTEFNAVTVLRTRKDLTRFTQVRVLVNNQTVGASGAEIRGQYSLNESSWDYLDGSSGPGANVGTTGVRSSAWVSLATAAKADVFLRIIGIDGDGAADPVFGLIALEFR